jgi:large subunit ribosomal protein L15
MPLFRRLAKRGFSAGDSSVLKYVAVVNVGAFDALSAVDGPLTLAVLSNAGIVPRSARVLRVLGGGDLTRSVSVEANYFSRSALKKISDLGGIANVL